MDIYIIIPTVAYTVLALRIVYHALSLKKQDTSLGECLLPLKRKNKKSLPFVILLCAIFIGILYVRRFEIWLNIVFASIGVLAAELVIKDAILQKRNGVYTKAIVTNGKCIYRDNIMAFPTLEYENDDEGTSVPEQMLKTVTHSSGVTYLVFDSKDERDAAVAIVKDWL